MKKEKSPAVMQDENRLLLQASNKAVCLESKNRVQQTYRNMNKSKRAAKKAAEEVMQKFRSFEPEARLVRGSALDKSKKSNVRQTLHGNPQRTFRSYVRQTEEVVVKAVRLSCLRRNKDHQKNLIDLLLNP